MTFMSKTGQLAEHSNEKIHDRQSIRMTTIMPWIGHLMSTINSLIMFDEFMQTLNKANPDCSWSSGPRKAWLAVDFESALKRDFEGGGGSPLT